MSNSNSNGTPVTAAPPEPDDADATVGEAPEPLSKPVSIRMPVAMIEGLKKAAMDHGFKGYQALAKHIIATWLQDGAVPNQAVAVAPAPPEPRKSRKQLREALLGAVYLCEEARKQGRMDAVAELAAEIERLREELDAYDEGAY